MIRDQDLKSAIDYSEGQKSAAYTVLGEIVNLLNEFSDDMRIIGGWVPALLYPESDHIGSIDVDVLLNQQRIKKAESYKTIKRILEQNGYSKHPEKYFSFVKTAPISGVDYSVDIDFLSGKYGGMEAVSVNTSTGSRRFRQQAVILLLIFRPTIFKLNICVKMVPRISGM